MELLKARRTECDALGKGLEQQLEAFLTDHSDTVLIIVDTLQMIRGVHCDNAYANDYRNLSVLKKIADKHRVAILLLPHLRKEAADDVFVRISGTTAISGAVDSSFTLVEEQRGSGRATLYCVGRDIEYREITLERNDENIWEVQADSFCEPERLGDKVVQLLDRLTKEHPTLIGTPTELVEAIDPLETENIFSKQIARRIKQSAGMLGKLGITGLTRRSNGKRLIELHRADSAAEQDIPRVDPVAPASARHWPP